MNHRKKSHRSFWSLVWTQFFGAINDNILKVVLIFTVLYGFWEGKLGQGEQAQSWVNYVFTIPFILLSGYAGTFADRNSKNNVVLWVKLIELPIAIVAALGFWLQDVWITLAALVALSCQSSYFGPAKYGMIPEIVESRDLSRANGLINMMTNIAVIVGTLLAGQIATYYSPSTEKIANGAVPMLWLPGLMMILVAIAGIVAAQFLPRLEPGDKNVQYTLNPIGTYFSSLKEIAGTPLFTVMFAWSYFYFLSGLALSILPEYAGVLKVDPDEAAVLMGVLGIAIGIGCVLAGFLSGDAIRPRLVPFGGIGLAVFFLLMGAIPATLPFFPETPYLRILVCPTALFVLGAGISAGFYIVPLQALLQHLTPDDELGRFLGTANGLSWTFLFVAAIFYQIVRPNFDIANQMFMVSSGLMVLGIAFFVWRVRARGFSLKKVE